MRLLFLGLAACSTPTAVPVDTGSPGGAPTATPDPTPLDPEPCTLYQRAAVDLGLATACADVDVPYEPPVTPDPGAGNLRVRFAPMCEDGTATCPEDERLRCVDGTRPAYHVAPAACLATGDCDPNRWLMFFQGGGSCTGDLCLERYADPEAFREMGTAHPSGAAIPERRPGAGILSERPDNAFRDFNRIYVHKCSFDRYLGDRTTPLDDGLGETVELFFHGRRIVTSVLADLARTSGDVRIGEVVLPDLRGASQFLAVGNSGGAASVTHNADWLHDAVRDWAPEVSYAAVLAARPRESGEVEAAFEVGGDCDATCTAYDFDREGTSEVLPDDSTRSPTTLTRDVSAYALGGSERARAAPDRVGGQVLARPRLTWELRCPGAEMEFTEADLVAKLLRIEALWAGAATPGERDAASAARDRVQARLAEAQARDPAIEYQFSLHDPWSRKLFLALLRRHGLRPYRYPRQRRTTIMVRVSQSFVDETLWPHFESLERELRVYLSNVTDRIVQQALGSNADEAEEQREPPKLRSAT